MATYAVGDLQGCLKPLQCLLERVAFNPAQDKLWLVGDLVNRGPESLATLRFLYSIRDALTCVLGNHDLHLLAAAQGVRPPHKNDTIAQVLDAPEAPQWIEWLRCQRLAHLEAGWLCVHAGVVPQWTCDQTLALAAELQGLLRGPGLGDFLRQMYGNQPAQWSESLVGIERARFVVNALTRMRFCTAQGLMDFKTKDGTDAAPQGYFPWFRVPGRATAEQPMAFGHWSTLGLINEPMLLATDTGCVWGGALTAVRVDGGRREVIQVPCTQAQQPLA